MWMKMQGGYRCKVDEDVRWIQMQDGCKMDADIIKVDKDVMWMKMQGGYRCKVDEDVRWIQMQDGCKMDADIIRWIKM